MGKMPRQPDPHPDAVLRVAIFGVTEQLKKLTERCSFARARNVDPSWKLTCTIFKQTLAAWASNVTAAEAFGLITSDELTTILQNVSAYQLVIDDILEDEINKKKKKTDRERLGEFKAQVSFLLGEIEDMGSNHPDQKDEMDAIGADLNDIEDRLEALMGEVQ